MTEIGCRATDEEAGNVPCSDHDKPEYDICLDVSPLQYNTLLGPHTWDWTSQMRPTNLIATNGMPTALEYALHSLNLFKKNLPITLFIVVFVLACNRIIPPKQNVKTAILFPAISV